MAKYSAGKYDQIIYAINAVAITGSISGASTMSAVISEKINVTSSINGVSNIPAATISGQFDLSSATSDNLCPDFSQWTLAGGATLNVDGSISFSAYGQSATSPLIPISQVDNWYLAVDAYDTQESPYAPFQPNGGILFNSSYFAQDGTTAVKNTKGYTANGSSQAVTLNQWTRMEWGYVGGSGVYYVKFAILTSNAWTPASYSVRSPSLTTDGNYNFELYPRSTTVSTLLATPTGDFTASATINAVSSLSCNVTGSFTGSGSVAANSSVTGNITGSYKVSSSISSTSSLNAVSSQVSMEITAVVNGDNICPDINQWTLSGGAYIDSNGNLILPQYGAWAISPLIDIGYAPTETFSFDFYSDEEAAYASYQPNSTPLVASWYYDANLNPVKNSIGYTSDGWIHSAPVGSWTRLTIQPFIYGTNDNAKYVKAMFQSSSTYTPSSYTVKNIMMTTNGATSPYTEYNGFTESFHASSHMVATPSVNAAVSGGIAGNSTLAGTGSGVFSLSGSIRGQPVYGTKTYGQATYSASDMRASGSIFRLISSSINAVSSISDVIQESISLSGSIGGTSAVSAQVSGGYPLASAISAVSSVSGNAQGAFRLVGSVSGTSTITSTITNAIALTGNISASTSLNVQPIESDSITGTISASTNVAGIVTGSFTLAGAVNPSNTPIYGQKQYGTFGYNPALSKLSGTVTKEIYLSGSVGSASDINAAVSKFTPITGSITATSLLNVDTFEFDFVAGAISTYSVLSGNPSGAFAISGAINPVNMPVYGQVTYGFVLYDPLLSKLQATAYKQIQVSGEISNTSGVAATVSENAWISGSINGTSALNAQAIESDSLQSVLSAASIMQGIPTGSFALSGTINPANIGLYSQKQYGTLRYNQLGSSLKTDSQKQIQLVGSVGTTSSIEVQPTNAISLTGSVSSVSSVSGIGIVAYVYFDSGSISAVSSMFANVTETIAASGSISGISAISATAQKTEVIFISGTFVPNTSIGGEFNNAIHVSANQVTSSALNGEFAQNVSVESQYMPNVGISSVYAASQPIQATMNTSAQVTAEFSTTVNLNGTVFISNTITSQYAPTIVETGAFDPVLKLAG